MTEPYTLLEDSPGKIVLLLGNEAIARGAVEAGVCVVAAYPGTPSSEVADTLSELAPKGGFYMEYSTNEKVAMEAAAAASFCGLRSLTCMKLVGLNVASDALMSLVQTGTRGGMVVVVADDPNCWSSQNEQDNRLFALLLGIPMLEPSDPQEAKDMTVYAFELSEELEKPIMLRTTTRVSHARSDVIFGPIKRRPSLKGEFKRDPRFAILPARARINHKRLLETLEKARRISEESKWNFIVGDGDIGIVTSGVAYNYVIEALRILNLQASVLKLGFTLPLPEEKIASFISQHNPTIVIEELEPYLENHVRIISSKLEQKVKILGKHDDFFPRTGEFDTRVVINGLSRGLNLASIPTFHEIDEAYAKVRQMLPIRPPILCPGCPHRASFYIIKVASKGLEPIYPNDIGCYSLAANPPYEMYDIMLCMGSGTGIACGLSVAQDKPIIAFAGDSTFYHACIPALIDAVYNRHSFILAVLDNKATAMTGFQPHPGTGISGMGEPAPVVNIEDIARGCGVKLVYVIDPYNVKESIRIFRKVLREVHEGKEVAVVVFRRECSILAVREMRKAGVPIIPYKVNLDKCTACKLCIEQFACPAISLEDRKVFIDSILCAGCGVCNQICPYNAIERSE